MGLVPSRRHLGAAALVIVGILAVEALPAVDPWLAWPIGTGDVVYHLSLGGHDLLLVAVFGAGAWVARDSFLVPAVLIAALFWLLYVVIVVALVAPTGAIDGPAFALFSAGFLLTWIVIAVSGALLGAALRRRLSRT